MSSDIQALRSFLGHVKDSANRSPYPVVFGDSSQFR